jgi:2-isopropylmalate synthase
VQHITEDSGTEISPAELWATFHSEYLPDEPSVRLLGHELTTKGDGATITAQLLIDGEHTTITGKGNGPIAAFVHGLQAELGFDVEVVDYSEHAVTAGTDAQAVAYVEARGEEGIRWGVGMDESITTASLKAVLSAVNRLRMGEP